MLILGEKSSIVMLKKRIISSKVLFAQENTPSLMFLKVFISYHGSDVAHLEHLKQPYNLKIFWFQKFSLFLSRDGNIHKLFLQCITK